MADQLQQFESQNSLWQTSYSIFKAKELKDYSAWRITFAWFSRGTASNFKCIITGCTKQLVYRSELRFPRVFFDTTSTDASSP